MERKISTSTRPTMSGIGGRLTKLLKNKSLPVAIKQIKTTLREHESTWNKRLITLPK